MFFPMITPPLPVIEYVDKDAKRQLDAARYLDKLLRENPNSKPMMVLKNGQLKELNRKELIKLIKIKLKKYAQQGIEM